MCSLKPCLRFILLSFILPALAFSMLILAGGHLSAAEDIVVDSNGNGDHTSIQSAIDAAGEGDTLKVWAGEYNENVIVNKTLTLVGNGSEETRINGGGGGTGIYINADYVNVTGFGFSVKGSDTNIAAQGDHVQIENNDCSWARDTGISFAGTNFVKVLNNNCSGANSGLYIQNAANFTLLGNNCSGTKFYGIYIRGGRDQKIENNTCLNGEDYGIYQKQVTNSSFIGNKCSYNEGSGIYVEYGTKITITGNSLLDNEYGLYLDYTTSSLLSQNTCMFHEKEETRGIYLKWAEGTRLENNSCKDNYYGIWVDRGSENQLVNNEFSRNNEDIILQDTDHNQVLDHVNASILLIGSDDNLIRENHLAGNSAMVLAAYSTGNIIADNVFSGTIGIRLGLGTPAHSNTLENNSFTGCWYGIRLIESNSNILRNNNFTSCTEAAILLGDSSLSNTLEGNIITGSGKDGILIDRSRWNILLDNTISGSGEAGIRMYNADGTMVRNCALFGNPVGIKVEGDSEDVIIRGCSITNNNDFGLAANSNSGKEVNATANWWGDDYGPHHATLNPYGKGDNISSFVIFDSWVGSEKFNIYVDDDAPEGGNGSREAPFRTIQEGLDTVLDRGTLHIWDGNYTGNFILDRTVSLVGNGSGKTIINDGEMEDHIIMVTANWVNVSGFHLVGADTSYSGLRVVADNATLSDINVTDKGAGISIGGSLNTIFNCSFANRGTGSASAIDLGGSGNIVMNSSFFNCSDRGISLSGRHNILSGNVFRKVRYAISSYSFHSTIENCSIRESEIGITFNDAEENKVTGCSITKCTTGISQNHQASSNNVCYNNDLGGNDWGIKVNDGGILDARYNWWGNDSGPYDKKGNPGGLGSNVTDFVNYLPWKMESEPVYNVNTGTWYFYLDRALEETLPGHVIEVHGGWHSPLVLDIAITIRAVGPELAFINAGKYGDAVVISSNWVSISGFSLTGGGPRRAGLIAENVENITISGMNCSGENMMGMFLKNVSNSRVQDSLGSSSELGLYLENCFNITVLNFSAWNNTDLGIYFDRTRNSTVIESWSSDNGKGGLCLDESTDNLIQNSSFSRNGLAGVYFFDHAHDNALENCTITKNQEGIAVTGSSQGIQVHNSTISGNLVYGLNATGNGGSFFDAQYNWWGSKFGPYHESMNPHGSGDNVTDGTDFKPWTGWEIKHAPVITGPQPPNSTLEDEYYYFALYAEDEDILHYGDKLSWELMEGPAWLSLHSFRWELKGTPSNYDVGIFFVNITVVDRYGLFDYITFELEVRNENDAPELFTRDPEEVVEEDELYWYRFQARDEDDIHGDQLNWSYQSNASWLELDVESGILTGTPENRHVGQFYVNISVEDLGGLEDHLNYTITVQNINDRPEIKIISPEEDEILSGIVTVRGSYQDIDLADELKILIRVDEEDWQDVEMEPTTWMNPGRWWFKWNTFYYNNSVHALAVRINDSIVTEETTIQVVVENPYTGSEIILVPELEENELLLTVEGKIDTNGSLLPEEEEILLQLIWRGWVVNETSLVAFVGEFGAVFALDGLAPGVYTLRAAATMPNAEVVTGEETFKFHNPVTLGEMIYGGGRVGAETRGEGRTLEPGDTFRSGDLFTAETDTVLRLYHENLNATGTDAFVFLEAGTSSSFLLDGGYLDMGVGGGFAAFRFESWDGPFEDHIGGTRLRVHLGGNELLDTIFQDLEHYAVVSLLEKLVWEDTFFTLSPGTGGLAISSWGDMNVSNDAGDWKKLSYSETLLASKDKISPPFFSDHRQIQIHGTDSAPLASGWAGPVLPEIWINGLPINEVPKAHFMPSFASGNGTWALLPSGTKLDISLPCLAEKGNYSIYIHEFAGRDKSYRFNTSTGFNTTDNFSLSSDFNSLSITTNDPGRSYDLRLVGPSGYLYHDNSFRAEGFRLESYQKFEPAVKWGVLGKNVHPSAPPPSKDPQVYYTVNGTRYGLWVDITNEELHELMNPPGPPSGLLLSIAILVSFLLAAVRGYSPVPKRRP